MRLAISRVKNIFHERWAERCGELGIDVVRVDGLADDIISQLSDCDGFLWRWGLTDPIEKQHARKVLLAAKAAGVMVFPDHATCSHYDDKIAQKYLLEAMDAPLIETHAFFDEACARDWLAGADFPLVFKLTGGASSMNVRLCPDRAAALALCRRAFGRGFVSREGLRTNPGGRLRQLGEAPDWPARIGKLRGGLSKLAKLRRFSQREMGYVYFQRFLPGNDFDTRVLLIGERAFAFRRLNRSNDFRASGGGRIDYDPQGVDPAYLRSAFAVSARCGFQCMAYDFLRDEAGEPAICEISYAFVGGDTISACPGHWDRDLNWREGSLRAEDAILEDFIRAVETKDAER